MVAPDPPPPLYRAPQRPNCQQSDRRNTLVVLDDPADNPPQPPRPLQAEPSTALQFWDRLFQAAMAQFVATHVEEPGEIVKAQRSIRGRADWAGVFSQLEEAKLAYSAVDGSFRSRFRNLYRKAADNGAPPVLYAAKMAKDMVQSDFVSPVIGVIRVVVEAAANAAKLRQDVMGAFAALDRRFNQIEFYLQNFAGDKNIERASIALIAVVLHAVESVIGFFVSKTYKRIIKATFTIDQYRKKIDDSLADIDKNSSELIEEVEMSAAYTTRQFQTQVHADLGAIQRNQDGQSQGLDALARDVQTGVLQLVNSLHQKLDQILRLQATQFASPSFAGAAVGLFWDASTRSSGLHVQTNASPEDLLDWINIPDLASHDVSEMQSSSGGSGQLQGMMSAEQTRAQQLVVHRQFRHWLVSPQSARLLVHGGFAEARPISALSLFCASLHTALVAMPDLVLPLAFYCGLHADANPPDPDGAGADTSGHHRLMGPRALISSLICQLLCRFDFGPAVAVFRHRERAIRSGRLADLCNVFSALLHQLPRGTVVVCVVDGAVFYERPEFIDAMAVVLPAILQLSEDKSVDAIVKVLVTSPTTTMHVREAFDRDGENGEDGEDGEDGDRLISLATALDAVPDTGPAWLQRHLLALEAASASPGPES